MRFSNKDGRVDRAGDGERARRSGHLSEGEDVWIDETPDVQPMRRRTSREIDPGRVETGLLLALVTLLNTGDYTVAELVKIFKRSRPTIYRYISVLERLQEYSPFLDRRTNPESFNEYYDSEDDDWRER
jgi:hypothetical protein